MNMDTNNFRDTANTIIKHINNQYTVTDVDFLDGYFIFHHGKDSVIQFNIKELPGWKFGMWIEQSTNPKYNDITFFCQFEQNIDKFKPSCSTYRLELGEPLDGYSYWELDRVLYFIKTHKLKAWYRDYTGIDYNMEHAIFSTMIRTRIKSWWYHWKQEHLNPLLQKRFLHFVEKEVLPAIEPEAKIIDMGRGWYPRYDISCDSTTQKGCYSLFDDNDPLKIKWDKKIKLYKKIYANWDRPLDPDITYIPRKEVKENE